MSHRDNIRRIEIVSDKLNDLRDKVVFVGGSTASLYATAQQPFESRVTDDVDGIIEVINYSAHADFEEQLRKHGFVDDVNSHVRCRYIVRNSGENIVVDIMPTEDIGMGFQNRWYPEGFRNSITHPIAPGKTVRILAAPYFVATKLEAFKTRGRDNGIISKDFEDIVYVLENRDTIWQELSETNENVKAYLKAEFRKFLDHQDFENWIDYHVLFGSPPSTTWILTQLKEFVES